MPNDLARMPETPLAHVPGDIVDYMPKLLEVSMSDKFNKEAFDTLVAFAEKQQTIQQQQRFESAFARFQAQCPAIEPDMMSRHKKKVLNDAGIMSEVPARYPSLERVQETITPHLSANGLVYGWRDKIVDADKKQLTITCVISGMDNERKASATYPLVTGGGQSPQEIVMSAETYAKKASLLEVCGVRVLKGWDNDQAAFSEQATEKEAVQTVDDDQAKHINDLLVEWGGDDKGYEQVRKIVLTGYSVDKVADLPASAYDGICARIRTKIAEVKKQ